MRWPPKGTLVRKGGPVPLRTILHHLREDIQRLRTKGSFARHAAAVIGGNSVAMLSQLLLTPLIARIYGPEAYGAYAIYMALIVNLSSVSDLGYSMAYVLPREEGRFMHLLRFNIASALVLGALITALSLIPNLVFGVFPAWRPLGGWIHAVGLGVVVYALSVSFTQAFTRLKAFRTSATIGGVLEASIRGLLILLGWFAKGVLPMTFSDLLMRALAVPVYLAGLAKHGLKGIWSGWSWRAMKPVLLEYKRYPMMIFSERWVTTLGVQLPTFLLAADLRVVGEFGLGASLLMIPLRLMGYSLSTIYLQRMAELREDSEGSIARVTKGIFDRLSWLGLGPFLLLTFFADEGFAILFGEPWRNAGVISALLGPWFFARLVTDPMVSLFNVRKREHVMLIFGTIMLVVRLGAMLVARAEGADSATIIMLYGALSTLGQVILGILLLNEAGLNGWAHMLRGLLVFLVCATATAGLRYLILGTWLPVYTP